MTNLKNMKIRITSPKHCEEVQQALFDQGYVWGGYSGQAILHKDSAVWIFTYEDEDMSWAHQLAYGENHHNEEHFLTVGGLFITTDYFKQPETAYCKGCVGCGEADAKPTLKPLAQHNHERMLDIISALQAKVERKEKLDSAWLSELSYLNEFMETK